MDGWMDKTMLQGGRKMMITLVVDNNIINPVILVVYIKLKKLRKQFLMKQIII